LVVFACQHFEYLLTEFLYGQVAEIADRADELILVNGASLLEISLCQKGIVNLLIDLIGLDEGLLLEDFLLGERLKLFLQVCQLSFVKPLIKGARALA
jgi:hypothetical protein